MNDMFAKSGVKNANLEITVIRADGTVEHYGTVCRYVKNPFKRWLYNIFYTLRQRHRMRKYGRRHG